MESSKRKEEKQESEVRRLFMKYKLKHWHEKHPQGGLSLPPTNPKKKEML